jgi:hypothetical protein
VASTIRIRSAALVLPLLLLVFMPSAVAAVERSSGDSWTYDVSFVVSDVPVSGALTYSFIGEAVLEVNGTHLSVGAFRLSGEFSGLVAGSAYEVSLNGVFDGYRYESLEGIGTVGEETVLLIDVSTGYEGFQLASFMEVRELVKYSTPLLSGFDPLDPGTATEWNETVEMFRLTEYADDSSSHSEESTAVVEFNVSVSSSSELVETDAGAFSARRISVSDGTERDVMWYSETVGNFVRIESYDSTDEEPVFVAELASYEFGPDDDGAVLVLAVVLVLASLAILILTLTLAVRRARRRAFAGAREEDDTVSEQVVMSNESGDPPSKGAE